jgi:UDP-N-acetylmuramoylalanine-D-glutamate ligase
MRHWLAWLQIFMIRHSKLKLVEITGTNGKTTIASLLYQLFINTG